MTELKILDLMNLAGSELELQAPPKYLIILLGATATGKTALSLKLAKYFKTDILNVDSRQCYRELNIGTAKPKPAELREVKHHFIGHKSIREDYSAGIYGKEALNFCKQYFVNHNVLIAVGGSGLYIKALCGELDNYPKNKQLREKLNRTYEMEGLPYLQNQLETLDPDYFKSIDFKNPRRLIRALEIITLTGQKLADLKTPSIPLPFEILKIGLELSREKLYTRINRRVLAMVAAGLEAEVRGLEPHQNLPPLQTIGYREFFDYFRGQSTKTETIARIQQSTRRYAKRQITWFKKTNEVHWFQPTQTREIFDLLKSIL